MCIAMSFEETRYKEVERPREIEGNGSACQNERTPPKTLMPVTACKAPNNGPKPQNQKDECYVMLKHFV